MKLETLENGIGKIEKLNWKHWKVELETLEILENGIGKIGKCNQKHWKIHLGIGIINWICRKLE